MTVQGKPSTQVSFLGELQRRHVYKVGAMYAVAGWLLVQIATQVFPFFGISDAAVRWVVIAVAAGFPVALVLAWIFDLTPAGIVRTAELPPAGESPDARRERRGTERRLNYLLGGLLLIALGYVVLDRALIRPAVPAAGGAGKSIAVLPLVNTSGDPANEYFSDGLSEELIAVLAKIPDLKIIGRSSSFQFKGKADDSRSIGEKLGVAHLLEGSVRKQGERVRIVAELINAVDGQELWSETYDRELKDVFAVQAEIAAAVAEQLKVKLLGQAARAAPASGTANLGAHSALLQGKFFEQRFTQEDHRKAIAQFEEATRLDPHYALAFALLSRAQRTLAAVWGSGAELAAVYEQARRSAQTALALAPDLSEAHLALGWVLLTPDFDLPAAESEFRRADALAPSDPQIRNALAYLLADEGRLAEAETATRAALALDPLWAAPYLNLARIQMAQGDLDEAVITLNKVIEIQPDTSHTYAYLTVIDLQRGDAAAALRHAQLEGAGFWRDYAMTMALHAQPDRKPAEAALGKLVAEHPDDGAFQIAIVYALRREPDRMFDWLDHAYAVHDSGLTQLLVTPFVLDYRSDPRFAALCRKLKIEAPEAGADAQPARRGTGT